MLSEKKEKLEDLFCYVFFSQQKDKTNPRGYKQSSLVLVSRLKLIKIFHVTLIQTPLTKGSLSRDFQSIYKEQLRHKHSETNL